VCSVVEYLLFVNTDGGLKLSYGVELDFIPDRRGRCFSRGFIS